MTIDLDLSKDLSEAFFPLASPHRKFSRVDQRTPDAEVKGVVRTAPQGRKGATNDR